MKKVFKLMGLFVLILFSFFYTDKTLNIIKENDPIMVEINNNKDNYMVPAINGSVDGDYIIPGINGKEVDVDASYSNMKLVGKFNDSSLVYKDVVPDNSISLNKDKFIIKGNSSKNMVSILFVLSNDKYLDNLEKIIVDKNVNVNYFVDYSYLVNNSTRIKNLSNCEVYSYGNMGKYTSDSLLFSNNLISRITDNDAIFCIGNGNKDILSLCSSYGLYTLNPVYINSNDIYMQVKNSVSSGSIILLDINYNTVNNLILIIDFINGKGLRLSKLSDLLNENISN